MTAAEILAKAAIREGRWAQAFPMFGPERRGAPVVAYARLSESTIRVRSGIYEPDVIVVIDRTLVGMEDVWRGFKESGTAVLNSPDEPAILRKRLKREVAKMASVDATRIALEVMGKPFTNTPMLGALVRAVGFVDLDSIFQAVRERFPERVAEANVESIKRAYEEVRIG